jgi:hypothetical protein
MFAVFGFGLGKLVDKRVQDALGIPAIFLCSVAVEIRQLRGCRV